MYNHIHGNTMSHYFLFITICLIYIPSTVSWSLYFYYNHISDFHLNCNNYRCTLVKGLNMIIESDTVRMEVSNSKLDLTQTPWFSEIYVLMAMTMKITSCALVNIYQHFRATCCLHLQGRRVSCKAREGSTRTGVNKEPVGVM
jgi:hypothetical protein